MKTYSKFLSCSTLLCASVLLSMGTSARAAVNSLELPSIVEIIKAANGKVSPPSSLQLLNVSPVVYSGGVHIRCHGQSTGSATAEVTGGVAPYTYQWSGLPYQSGATANGMSAGTYSVIVTDAVGSSVTGSVTLTQNPPLQAVASVSPILCYGGVATVVVTAAGGTTPYYGESSYQLASGSYNFLVADANGCRNATTIEINEPPAFQAAATAAPILCNGGAAEVVVEGVGGFPPYAGTGLYQEQSGIASYIITDANGCYAYASVPVIEPPVLTIDVNHSDIKCRGGESQVVITGAGGTMPYSGVGPVTQIAGNYQYMISDANGCQASTSLVITQPTALVATISNSPIACNGDLSLVEVLATGGVGPYTGPGMFYEQGGLHWYTVEDANGCSVDIATMVVEPSPVELDITLTLPQSVGSGSIVDVQALGGTPSYFGTGSYTVSPGAYVFEVTDANGCLGSENITIPNPMLIEQSGMNGNEGGRIESDDDTELENLFVQASFNLDNEQAEISYQLEYDSEVQIELYDMTGALVQVLEEEMAYKGQNYTVTIDADDLQSGVYVCHIVTNSESKADKLHLLR